jgi:hypothetical protein
MNQDVNQLVLGFIYSNREDIFAYIENNKQPKLFEQFDAYDHSQDDIFQELVRLLICIFPICHCTPGNPQHREYDKIHYELAQTIINSFWCGCLPQMKENRGAYPPGTTAFFGTLVNSSFTIGQTYGPEEEQRRGNA